MISHFFDSHFSKFFSFLNPKTKSNAEVADVLLWMNRVAFLIEVKTRNKGLASIDSWVKSRIQEGVDQITANYKRIKAGETINLHNPYYHTRLDCDGLKEIIGLIVLVYEDECALFPSNAVPDIYNRPLPIHVISWNDLRQMTSEIDTVSDFRFYLNDRFECLKTADISLSSELNVLGYYKIHSNKFPNKPIDFAGVPYWDIYQSTMAEAISRRNSHNRHASWIDKLESGFPDPRRLFLGLPLGLYFAWEIGAISRRERASLGEKLATVQSWFIKGNTTRRFAWFNGNTGNWFVFYFSKSEPRKLEKELYRLVELKLIKEVEETSFKYATYGFGFQVTITFPPQLLGLTSAIVVGSEMVKGKYSASDLEEAHRNFGPKGSRLMRKIQEFPDN